jgi:hypothetical protein
MTMKVITKTEFTFSLLESFPTVKMFPEGREDLATRDRVTIRQWMQAGERLAFLGIQRKPPQPAGGP